ncbi:MAG: hypothetical protein HY822_15535 [Acidobacteria bacterium]|nr:hypothetical protein [Acidobacteriota bacterium]
MRYFLSNRVPPFTRLLLVESGSRYLLDNLLPDLPKIHGDQLQVDLVTCFAGLPEGFRPEHGRVYRVTDYPGRANRKRLYRELRANGYTVVGIVCAGEPIMTKWKWSLAWHLPAKLFILNENGDYFWFDRAHWSAVRHFLLFRAGLAGAGAVRTLARLAAFPFTLLYLLLYAAAVHLRGKVRT